MVFHSMQHNTDRLHVSRQFTKHNYFITKKPNISYNSHILTQAGLSYTHDMSVPYYDTYAPMLLKVKSFLSPELRAD